MAVSTEAGSPRLRVLAAPDSFKGTFSASEVASAMDRGLRAGEPRPVVVDECPVADGGEGTGEVLSRSLGGRWVPARAGDPLGREIEAGFTLLGNGEIALVESAAASGLTLVAPAERDAVAASSAGTGRLIAAASRSGARQILVAVGGTATTDGGLGAIEAIEAEGGTGRAELVILADVETAFEDAAVVFSPQKGASAGQVRALTDRLLETADALPRSPLGLERTGAGGGIAGGLWARYGAEIVSGADFVLDAIGFDRRLDLADAVLVGEGRLDEPSLDGKVVGRMLERSRGVDKPCHAIVGGCVLTRTELDRAGFGNVRSASSVEEIETAARSILQH